jgi:hypothetical protein
LITTSPVANKYTGVFNAFFVKDSVAPDEIVIVVQWKMPSGGN